MSTNTVNSETKVSDFFKDEFPNFAAYDVIRKCASYLDGLKLSHRKIMWTMLEYFPSPNTKTKTSQMAATVSLKSQYLHGETSLESCLDTMAAAYTGGNNYALIAGHGSFGTRFSPEAAAGRYTYVSISPLANTLFNKYDRELCQSQLFEGEKIEPAYYMPIFPVIFLNGSDGLSTGFKQQVYARNPKDIMRYIECVLQHKAAPNADRFAAWFRGFKGTTKYETVKDASGNTRTDMVNYGIVRKVNSTTIAIDEIPITYSYAKYIELLDKLVEKEVIQDYDDQCDPKTDNFSFVVKVKRVFFDEYPDEASWIKVFGLAKNLPEQLNCIDENGRIREFTSISEILNDFITKRLEFYELRKRHLLAKYTDEMKLDVSKLLWCDGIVKDTIAIRNKKKEDIEKQIANEPRIVKKDGSYDYLLRMPLSSITKEMMEKLKEDVKALKDTIITIKGKSATDMWLEDLAELKAYLK